MIRSIAVAVGLVLATGAVAQTPDAEIVVTAKVERIALTLGRDGDGRTTCGLTRSSGDVTIDDAMCRRASRCMKPGTIVPAKLDACVARQRKALVAAWLQGEKS